MLRRLVYNIDKSLEATLIALTAVLLTAAAPARAETADATAAEALFREGRRLLKAGQLEAACDKLADSQRADPAAGTLANLAECEERLGRLTSAWEHWRQAADLMAPSDPRRDTARARAQALEARLPRPNTVPPPVAVLPLPPPAGSSAKSGNAAPAAALQSGPAREWSAGRWRRTGGWALAGLGAAALGGGVYFGLQALEAREQARAACGGPGRPPTCWSTTARAMNRDLKYARLADAGFATGAAAGIGALYLLLGAGPGGDAQRTGVTALPRPGGGEVQLAGRF